ncbi:hypothetical protein [Actinomadura montaniterrae]|uniref:Uncharacterized protein n=1 Tax=Actinomadura montaniterrae TaxID=1803903 RepID=A0A6L3VTH3_9ACTN|nr:hypothetical protein [Actinomadura montaniterrae]KAB2375401.1 hypothetical protein F9B16_26130 [Actinomadura montaniterrae]
MVDMPRLLSGDLFDAIEDRFRESGMVAIKLDEPVWCGSPLDLGQVRDLLLEGHASEDFQDEVWRKIVQRARGGDEQWKLAAIWLLLPALRKISRHYGGWGADSGDVASEAVTAFFEELQKVDAAQARIGASLWWAARRRAAQVRLQRSREVPSEELALNAARQELGDHEVRPLVEAVHEGVISISEAQLINKTRLEGERLGAIAESMGLRYQACHRRRARAEGRLVGYLRIQGDAEDSTPEKRGHMHPRPEGDAA